MGMLLHTVTANINVLLHYKLKTQDVTDRKIIFNADHFAHLNHVQLNSMTLIIPSH